MNIPRPEHPKPQFQRDNWINLNGLWDFSYDNSRNGKHKGFYKDDYKFDMKINVPFCPESVLSGIGNTDFILGVWYKRSFIIPEGWANGTTYIHFGAVDYECDVYINEQHAGHHKGGYVSFKFDITKYLKEGENTICVYAEDDTRDTLIPSGKQSMEFASFGCFYTRTTGIWQTVWLENMPKSYIRSAKYYTDINTGSVTVIADTVGEGDISAEAFYEGKLMGKAEGKTRGGKVTLTLSLSEKHLWEIGNGRLYDLTLRLGDDEVKSYFGLREVALSGNKFLLNGRSIFQRTVLDQGFYPDGIYTAPSDAALKRDIELSLACGFNGARLHEKIFEERFLYHCDKLGYIVWGEYPDWGLDTKDPNTVYSILPEWLEEIERDFNHPAIIGWCPRNETYFDPYKPAIEHIYHATKAADPTRPCLDSSGGTHVVTDIYDDHDYKQDPAEFATVYGETLQGEKTVHIYTPHTAKYAGQPYFQSEYGGIRWTNKEGWGYGEGPRTEEEFKARFEGLTNVILNNPRIFGLCYTQLTDVEQEQNGLYTYDRKPKFDVNFFKSVLSKKAAIED